MSVELLVHAAQALAPVLEDAAGNSGSDGDSAAEHSDSDAPPASPAQPAIPGSVLYSSQLSFSKNASANSADSALVVDDRADQQDQHERDAASDGSLMCSHPGCTKTFFSRQALTRHMRVHQGLRPHFCTSCGNQFRCASHLKRHERQHSNSRPYRCPICSKAYIDHTNLIRHTVVQHNARPYVCGWPGCSNAFTMERTLREHITAAHGICPLRANGQAKRTFMIYGLEGVGDSSAGPACSSPSPLRQAVRDSVEQPEINASDDALPAPVPATQSAPVARVAASGVLPCSESTGGSGSPRKRTRHESQPVSTSAAVGSPRPAVGSPRSAKAAVVSSLVSTISTEPLMHPAIGAPSVSSVDTVMDAIARARFAVAPLAATAARMAAPAAPLIHMGGIPCADASPYLLGQPDTSYLMRPSYLSPWQVLGYPAHMSAGVDMAKSIAATRQILVTPTSLATATATTLVSPMMSSAASLRGAYSMPFGQVPPGPAWGINPMYSPYMSQLDALQAMQAYSMASGPYSMPSGPYSMPSGPSSLAAAYNPAFGLSRFGTGFLPSHQPGHQSTVFPQ